MKNMCYGHYTWWRSGRKKMSKYVLVLHATREQKRKNEKYVLNPLHMAWRKKLSKYVLALHATRDQKKKKNVIFVFRPLRVVEQ